MIAHISRKTKEILFITVGILSLLLGIAGIFLPLLPTTPFLLLTAYCFHRGSKKFHHWLIHHRIFGPPIKDWEQNQLIKRKTKIIATVMMAGSSVFVLFKPNIPLIGKVTYSVVLISVLVFIWTRRDH